MLARITKVIRSVGIVGGRLWDVTTVELNGEDDDLDDLDDLDDSDEDRRRSEAMQHGLADASNADDDENGSEDPEAKRRAEQTMRAERLAERVHLKLVPHQRARQRLVSVRCRFASPFVFSRGDIISTFHRSMSSRPSWSMKIAPNAGTRCSFSALAHLSRPTTDVIAPLATLRSNTVAAHSPKLGIRDVLGFGVSARIFASSVSRSMAASRARLQSGRARHTSRSLPVRGSTTRPRTR